MKSILDNPLLPDNQDWLQATQEPDSLHPDLLACPDIRTILDYGHWAPSGDNTQCWRFNIIDETHFDILASDVRHFCVYDLEGRASQLALGMLLENMLIGAATIGKKLFYELDDAAPDEHPLVHVRLEETGGGKTGSLADQVVLRTVNRRRLSRKPLSPEHKQELESSASPLNIKWFEGPEIKRTTRLFFDAADIRLRIPEGFATHSIIMDWAQRYSREKMPVDSFGASAFSRVMMKFSLKDWRRIHFFNRFMLGTWLPRIELDVIPGLFSGAHFILYQDKPLLDVADYVEAGRCVQRFWLTATKLGIQLQPQMTPLIFANYFKTGLKFTSDDKQYAKTGKMADQLLSLLNVDTRQLVFMGRMGYGKPAASRSVRKSLSDLMC